MPVFGDLDDEMQDALDDVYGERVRIEPQMPAGLRGRPAEGASPRPPVEIIGRFRKKPITSELEGNREGSRFQSMTRLAGNMLTLRVSPIEAAKVGFEIVGSDVVVLLDRLDEPRFTIARVGPRDSGELMIELTAGGAL